MPDAGFSIRGSGVGGATGTQGNYGVQSHQAGAAHGRVPGKASPNRPALGLPNGSSSVRLKLWRKLWRISGDDVLRMHKQLGRKVPMRSHQGRALRRCIQEPVSPGPRAERRDEMGSTKTPETLDFCTSQPKSDRRGQVRPRAIRLDAFSLLRYPLRTEAERKCHACDRTERRCAPHD